MNCQSSHFKLRSFWGIWGINEHHAACAFLVHFIMFWFQKKCAFFQKKKKTKTNKHQNLVKLHVPFHQDNACSDFLRSGCSGFPLWPLGWAEGGAATKGPCVPQLQLKMLCVLFGEGVNTNTYASMITFPLKSFLVGFYSFSMSSLFSSACSTRRNKETMNELI